MEINVPIRDIENLRVQPSNKIVGTTRPRLVLGEIGNKAHVEKEIESTKLNPFVAANPYSKTGSNFQKRVAVKVDIPHTKTIQQTRSQTINKEKGKNNPYTTCLWDPSASQWPVSQNQWSLIRGAKTKEDVGNVDQGDQKDIFLLGRYASDIYTYLLELELKLPITSDFLKGTLVTPNMRATLIDWLLDVQLHYSLLLETLHLAVSIIDRFLQNSGVVQRKYFQLVGITSMFLASKFEETYYPDISDFIYMTDNAYSKQQILDLEREIIKKLDFRLGRPISLVFLRRYSKIVQADQFVHTLGKYIIELALLETSLAHVRPSMIAAAAIYIASCIKVNGIKSNLWSPTLEYHSTYKLKDFLIIAKKLASLIIEAPDSKYKGIRNKYSQTEFLCISISKAVLPVSPILQKLSVMDWYKEQILAGQINMLYRLYRAVVSDPPILQKLSFINRFILKIS